MASCQRQSKLRPGSTAADCRHSPPRPRRAQLVPLRLAPLQEILGARTAQMRPTVLHDHLAVDIGGGIRNQKACEIGELAMFAGAAKRVARRPCRIAALGT